MVALATPGRCLGALGLVSTAPFLLRRMRREFEQTGALSGWTTVGMYGAYLTHAGLFVRALVSTRTTRARTGSPGGRVVRAVGLGAATGGGALCVAGMRRFAGGAQVSGTMQGPLVEGGVYRLTRNPQYVGYLLALGGSALAARSGEALALATAAAGVYAWWVPAEEQALEAAFGDDYSAYRSRTRRWL